jgi:hypothetical protein
MTTGIQKRFWPLLAVLIATAAVAIGGRTSYTDPDGYAYYDIWWMEHKSDRKTSLLLHFNQPRSPGWTRPGDRKIAGEQEAQAAEGGGALGEGLIDGGMDMDALGGDMGGSAALGGMGDFSEEHLEKKAQAEGRHRDEKAPKGIVYDYSPNLLEIKLPGGVRKVEGGRFGKALKLTGTTGLRTLIAKKGGAHAMEGWFRIDAYPAETVCLFASGADGVRLLLHPDGQLEAIQLPEKEEYPSSMRTDQPIPTGEWVHISCYTWVAKHIEWVGNPDIPARAHWRRIGVNGRVAAEIQARRIVAGHRGPAHLLQRGNFYIGMNPDRGQVFTGLMDEVRVAGWRRYNTRPPYPWRDPTATRPIPFGPPHFQADARIFHASFESREMTVHPDGQPAFEWDLGEHADLAHYQVPGVYGKALLIDPAMGFPRIPIQGFSPKEGSLELWFQPVNWDNHTDFGKINWGAHTMSVARFMGRDTKTGEVVRFMHFKLPRATIHGVHDWIHPGTWFHFIWTWSPEDVYQKDGAWGSDPPKKGDPLQLFRATCEGEGIYKAVITRDTDLLDRIEPLYLELGISDDITVYHGQRPAILVDELVGHGRALSDEEILKAPKRWMGKLESAGE